MTGGHDKSSILADGVESLLGAVYLEHGFDVARTVVLKLFGELLDTAPSLGAALEWKTSLQELTVRAQARRADLRRDLQRARPRQGVHGRGPGQRRRSTGPVSARPRRKPSSKAAAEAWTAACLGAAPDGQPAGGNA